LNVACLISDGLNFIKFLYVCEGCVSGSFKVNLWKVGQKRMRGSLEFDYKLSACSTIEANGEDFEN
jgi:hypothetical protein